MKKLLNTILLLALLLCYNSCIDSKYIYEKEAPIEEFVIVTTGEVTDITSVSASISGYVEQLIIEEGTNVEIGIVYSSTDSIPDINNGITILSDSEAEGKYTVSLTGLSDNTTYFYRSYVITDNNVYYGEVSMFTTKDEITPVLEKIEAGFNKESVEQLFNFDPVANLGLPAYDQKVGPSLAALGGKLVICLGDGSTPIYINGLTGVKMGEINLGDAVAGSVTNDEAENMLIVNHANGGETVNIYRTSSVTEAPTLFHSFTNSIDIPMGAKMKVIGNIDSDALIIFTNEGIEGVTSSNRITSLTVQGGQVVAEQVVTLPLSWGPAPVNIGTVVAASTNPADGYLQSQYSPSFLTWVNGDGSIFAQFNSDTTGWGLNPNCLDSKRFNNNNYVALFVVSQFPAWGMGPQLYLYNVNDKSKFTGTSVTDLACLELTNQAIVWYQTGSYSIASGDVVIAPSADGFKLYIYYYDHNSQVVGGYVADCIKK